MKKYNQSRLTTSENKKKYFIFSFYKINIKQNNQSRGYEIRNTNGIDCAIEIVLKLVCDLFVGGALTCDLDV